ncbi:MAG TPA: peptidylprolyl isomerase [Acidimicrobiia bacterium]|nr:peptidylprolyl isomerase [Acidimicrobiia bacterium]
MKKLIISLVVLSALFVSGCSSKSKSADTEKSTTTSTEETTTTTTAVPSTSCGEPLLDATKSYSVVFNTSKGSFTVALDVKNAPTSTAHLAALVQAGFYTNLTFHRVVPDFVIQGGDPNGNGTGSSQCSVISEEPPRPYKQGDFAWAKGGNDPAGKAGSQFFIITGGANSDDVAALNQKALQSDGSSKIQYGYAGSVTSGLNVALAIEALAPATVGGGTPTQKATITSAELIQN